MKTITDEERKYVRNFINDKCIARVPHDSKKIPAIHNNGFYVWQFYLRPVLYDKKSMEIITKDFFLKHKGFNFSKFRLAGVESSSVPMLVAFSQEAYRYGVNLDFISVRKKAKEYGLLHSVEGKFNMESPVMIVDDLISTNHIWNKHTVDILNQTNIMLLDRMYSIVNKNTPFGDKKVVVNNQCFTLESMFTLADFDLEYEKYYGK